MALIKCPKCGMQFSDRAAACPHCGATKQEIERLLEQKEKEAEEQRIRAAKRAKQQRIHTAKRAKQKKIFRKVYLIALLLLFVFYCLIYFVGCRKSESSYSTQSYSTPSNKSCGSNSNQYDDSSTKWKEFAGTTYRASQFTSEGYQYYAFIYDSTGKGKYIIWWNYRGTNVWRTKWSTLYTKWSPKGTIYISIRMNSIIL